jgi:membrane protein DedA with SNARE-associated domain
VSFLSAQIAAFAASVVGGMGYAGLFLMMTLEGIVTPIPSEVIVPFAGYLAAQGVLSLPLVVLVATAGATLGSTVAYHLGRWAGRPLVERYGRFVRIGERELRRAEEWFEKYGDRENLIGHAIPGVRSFISFPAGIARMDVRRYVVFTAIGSAMWNVVLALAGYFLLDRWLAFAEATQGVDLLILAAALLAIGGYVFWRMRARRADAAPG